MAQVEVVNYLFGFPMEEVYWRTWGTDEQQGVVSQISLKYENGGCEVWRIGQMDGEEKIFHAWVDKDMPKGFMLGIHSLSPEQQEQSILEWMAENGLFDGDYGVFDYEFEGQ